MDRPEKGPAQRARIDATYLSDPNLTLHVPAAAWAEVMANDKFGTQAPRLAGRPGGARVLRDVDGNIAGLDLSKIVSKYFDENDLRIAMRARERTLPLLTANSKMAAQVVDGNFPARVAALAGVLIEVAP